MKKGFIQHLFSNPKDLKISAGFSLVELLVVVSIFFIITGIALFKQSKFSSDILITNTAYEVALAIREAQVYGVGSKQSSFVSSGDDRRKSYGLAFNNLAPNNSFWMYAESPYDTQKKLYHSIYKPADSSYDLIDTITFNREQKIVDLCGTDMDDEETCDVAYLDIAFVKPNLDAVMNARTTLGGTVTPLKEARVVVQSSLGDKCRTIKVNKVGQIIIEPITAGSDGCN